jgi:hypothetical protein
MRSKMNGDKSLKLVPLYEWFNHMYPNRLIV